VLAAWDGVEILSVETDVAVASLGTDRAVDAEVSLGALDPGDIEVQLLHGLVGQSDELEQPTVVPMTDTGDGPGASRRYRGEFTCENAGRYGFTVRVVPSHPWLTNPVELGRIAWA
jgi:starch phosphorylase